MIAYTFSDGAIDATISWRLDSTVTWRLEAEAMGTRLLLEHTDSILTRRWVGGPMREWVQDGRMYWPASRMR